MSDSTTTAPPATEGTPPSAPKPTPPPATAPSEGSTTGPVQLPDDHPLVKALAAQKAEITALKAADNAGKTEAQQNAERLAAIEKRATDAEARVTRRDLALEHKLSKDDAALLDNLTDEAAMKALAARLAGESDKKRNHVPREGNNPTAGGADSDVREFVRGLFNTVD